MEDTERRLVGGRYQIGDLLGYGGMAEVFRGRDVRLGRDVAVKILRSDLARDPSFQLRFRREAQAAASLNHPHIVSVFDTGDDPIGGTVVPYIVMEYIHGQTLRDILHREGPVPWRRALEVVAEICAALEYSHRAGIVHRDIKPGNVMVTDEGDVKVMDFGIARAISDSSATMTQTAAVVGTAQYLSPEQARGESVDARSDVYSTGCLLYELLTGSPPFQGDSAVAVAYQHVREDPTYPSQLDPSLPAALDAVVLKAMAKNPANRYQSAAEFREDLARAAAGRRVEATPLLPPLEATQAIAPVPVTTLMRNGVAEPRRRRRFGWLLLVLAVLAVFVVAALLARTLLKDRKPAQVTTPNVVNESLAQATADLQGHGLQVGTVTRTFSDRPKDTVLSQDPGAGILADRNAGVNLTVSKGVEIVTVPQVVGAKQDDATKAIQAAKLKVGTITTREANAAQGTVLDVSPAAGTSLPAGSEVGLTVASGQVLVPNVTGQSLDAANTALSSAGLASTVVRVPNSAPPNTVLNQDPAGGSTVTRGATVKLTVSAPLPAPSPTPSPTPSPKPKPTPSPSAKPTPLPTP